MTTYAVVGRPVTRQEGPDKVSGTFLYSADVALPGMIWGKVLRSPFSHARIVNIDATRALSLAGVRAVITGKDTAGMRVGRMVRDVPLLAEDTVRFVGEKVAAVAAVDPDTAEEALTRIDVEYEPLPAIFDPLEAMEPEPPGPRGLAHLCVCVRPHSAAREYPEPRHLVCRRPGARLPRIGPDFRAYLYHHLGAPGLHGALCLRCGYRRRRAHAGVGQQQSALRCESSSPTRWGSLKTRSSSTPVASAATSAASRPP